MLGSLKDKTLIFVDGLNCVSAKRLLRRGPKVDASG
jgi:hypothetical protein